MRKILALLVMVLFAAAVWSQQSTIGGVGSGSGQPASANLTNWSNVSTQEVVFTNTFRDYTNALTTHYQRGSANLTNWSGFATNTLKEGAFVTTNLFNTDQFAFTGGAVPMVNIKDGPSITNMQQYGNMSLLGQVTVPGGQPSIVTLDAVGRFTYSSVSKGSLLTGDGSDLTSVNVGANNYVLTADSGETAGFKWAATGNVVGPASATDNRIAVYDGTTGKLLKDGGSTIANVLDRANHTGTQLLSTISDRGTLPDWSLLNTNMLRTVTNNFSVFVTGGVATNVVDMSLGSSTNILNGALTMVHATNGVSSFERTHVRWFWAGGSDRAFAIPSTWKTNVNSAVPANITNGTITKMYVTTIGDTASSANQTNVYVSFEFYK